MPEQPRTASEAPFSPPQLLAVALDAAQAAASLIRDAAPKVGSIVWQENGSTDFVSEVDIGAEKTILEIVRRRVPGAGFLAEESASVISSENQRSGVVFVIDPLDGTTNFLHGYPEYAVSIGVLVEGVLTAGVVIDVPSNEVFTATKGGGAQLNGAPIRVSAIDNPQRSLFGTGFPFVRNEEIAPYVAQLSAVMAAAAGARRAGAAALDLASVACGRFEGFWEMKLSPWDIAAGMLLVREAGGIVTNFEGEECPVARTSVVAGSAVMHPWLLRTINNAGDAPER
ncbi:MAG TPA: inositol monophosphatase family protein, partial [Gemmatimonadaceae bacterium]|nr:inositol monophosphatase family protein [Gemmatimonadaceae bacterium]